MTDSPLNWARHLPADAVREMLAEIAETADRAVSVDPFATLAALDTVLAAWRSTAQVHADPELYAALTQIADHIDPEVTT